jgi:hypothetical protein
VIVPQVSSAQFDPERLQVTAVLAFPVTVAVNWTGVALPSWVDVLLGLTLTTTPATDPTVMVAVPTAVLFACEVAETVTWLSGLGGAAGAVYTPSVVIVPQVASKQFAPDRVHATA